MAGAVVQKTQTGRARLWHLAPLPPFADGAAAYGVRTRVRA